MEQIPLMLMRLLRLSQLLFRRYPPSVPHLVLFRTVDRHTINNLDNVVENTTSAESQIRDTDMATEMVKYSNNNILAPGRSGYAGSVQSG